MSDNFLLNQLKFIPFLFIQNFDLLILALSFSFSLFEEGLANEPEGC